MLAGKLAGLKPWPAVANGMHSTAALACPLLHCGAILHQPPGRSLLALLQGVRHQQLANRREAAGQPVSGLLPRPSPQPGLWPATAAVRVALRQDSYWAAIFFCCLLLPPVPLHAAHTEKPSCGWSGCRRVKPRPAERGIRQPCHPSQQPSRRWRTLNDGPSPCCCLTARSVHRTSFSSAPPPVGGRGSCAAGAALPQHPAPPRPCHAMASSAQPACTIGRRIPCRVHSSGRAGPCCKPGSLQPRSPETCGRWAQAGASQKRWRRTGTSRSRRSTSSPSSCASSAWLTATGRRCPAPPAPAGRSERW